MRRSREIVVLLLLLVGAMAFVLWYVHDRRSRLPAAGAAQTVRADAPGQVAPGPTPAPAPAPVDLKAHDGQTIDFSGGKPVVKNSAADQAALQAGLRDIADATADVTFGPAPKKPASAPGKP